MSKFKIERALIKNDARTAIDATLSRVRIQLADRTVTNWTSEVEDGGETLEIPAYYLAEWAAENWWPLLWEPRKSEDSGDDADFLSRHSVLTAQHGFALPNLMFVPHGGDQVSVSCQSRFVPFAECRFRKGASAMLPRKDVEGELRKFVEGVVAQLKKLGKGATDLEEEWARVSETSADEVEFFRLVGALGLSPYAVPDRLAEILEAAGERHSFNILLDLCQASTPEALAASLALADKAQELTANAPESDLALLLRRPPPADNPFGPGWRHGVNAARAARTALKISDDDPEGSSKLFDLLKIDPALGIQLAGSSADPSSAGDITDIGTIVGAVERDATRSKIALLQRGLPQRRFSAARAAYLAWTSETPQASRLMTTAVTRDQQASRAFAAEITAPIMFIRKQNGTKRTLAQVDIYAISNQLGVAPDVVRKQASNNDIVTVK